MRFPLLLCFVVTWVPLVASGPARADEVSDEAFVASATLDDHRRAARALVRRAEPPAPAEIAEFDGTTQLLAREGSELAAAQLQCELAARIEDPKRLESCTTVLKRLAPNAAKTRVHLWALALQRGNVGEAARLLDGLRPSSLPPATLAEMERVQALAGPRANEHLWSALFGLAFFAGVGLVLYKSASTRFAALKPHMPCVPPPGCVELEHKYSPSIGIR
jgi:hypothetical protein